MNRIIPRDLIKHLEWTPGAKPVTSRKTKKTVEIKSEAEVEFKENISKFIQVGINGIYGKPVVISPFEMEGYNNKNYNNTHRMLLRNGLYMPTPFIFMTHFKNVMDAIQGRGKLLYADGTEVEEELKVDIYKHLTEDFKDAYGGENPGAWTWLNAQFEEGDEWKLKTVIGIDEAKKKLKIKTETLESFLEEDCLVDLSFNSQGLPKPDARSVSQEYKKRKNIYFYQPQDNAVARFNANSDGARLNCNGNPSVRDASLGVFGCAEGTHKKVEEARI